MLLARYIKLFVIGGLVLSLQACQMAFDINRDEDESADSLLTNENKTASDSSEDVYIPSENPYLATKKSVNDDEILLWDSGLAAMKSEDWVIAEKIFLTLVEKNPSLSGPLLNLAAIYNRNGNEKKALVYSALAIETNALNGDAYNYRAYLLREAGRFSEAEAIYLQSLGVWKDNPDSHRNLGILYDLYLGKQELAIKHYQYYQALLTTSDRQVKGWIIDLERRVKQQNGG